MAYGSIIYDLRFIFYIITYFAKDKNDHSAQSFQEALDDALISHEKS